VITRWERVVSDVLWSQLLARPIVLAVNQTPYILSIFTCSFSHMSQAFGV